MSERKGYSERCESCGSPDPAKRWGVPLSGTDLLRECASSWHTEGLTEERDALRAERDDAREHRDTAEAVLAFKRAQVARLEEALREIARLEGMASASDIARNALSQDTESPRCPTCGLTQTAWIGTWPRSCPDDFHTESPRPANCDCGCSPPGPGLHYANCPAATADDTESPEEPA